MVSGSFILTEQSHRPFSDKIFYQVSSLVTFSAEWPSLPQCLALCLNIIIHSFILWSQCQSTRSVVLKSPVRRNEWGSCCIMVLIFGNVFFGDEDRPVYWYSRVLSCGTLTRLTNSKWEMMYGFSCLNEVPFSPHKWRQQHAWCSILFSVTANDSHTVIRPPQFNSWISLFTTFKCSLT